MSIATVTNRYPTLTDEKLEDYLGVWNRLIDQGHRKMLDITLRADYGGFAYPRLSLYTLTYGEERRGLTYEQAWRVKDWLDSRGRLT
jgi:hypothetical protein